MDEGAIGVRVGSAATLAVVCDVKISDVPRTVAVRHGGIFPIPPVSSLHYVPSYTST